MDLIFHPVPFLNVIDGSLEMYELDFPYLIGDNKIMKRFRLDAIPSPIC